MHAGLLDTDSDMQFNIFPIYRT